MTDKEGKADSQPFHLILLAKDYKGYQNLCRLITRMKLGAPKGSASLALEHLEPSTAGLVCLTGGARGPLALRLAAGDDDGARRTLDQLVALFGRSSCFVEVQRQYSREQEQMLQRLVALARSARVPLVASNQPLFARPEGRPLADVFTCIREKTDLDHAGRRLLTNGERSLKSAHAMTELFRDLPDALDNTGELALRLAFTLKDLGYRFPEFPLPPGQTPLGYLRELTERLRLPWKNVNDNRAFEKVCNVQLDKSPKLISC
jgi:error-prone DNA polymerase